MTTILPTERLANLGYLMVGKQSNSTTPVTPSVAAYLYKESLMTDLKIDLDNPISGQRMKIINAYMGLRAHTGTLTVLAEPNTAQFWFDMMLNAGSITGGGPYTHPFVLSDPQNYYTIDLLKGQIVFRFFGVQAESITHAYDKNKMTFDVDVSAKGAFSVRTIASTSASPNHVVLDTSYDPNPTLGLVAGDLIRLYAVDGSATLDTTISSLTGPATIVTAADPSSIAAGSSVFLRTQGTPTFATLNPFLWTRTQFQFSDTASDALGAAQTNMEEGTKFKLAYMFENKEGAKRSGSFDPVSLPRLQGEAQLSAKVFFDQPFDYARFVDVAPRACVIRMFSGAGDELRVTLDSMIQKTSKLPLETNKLVYNEIEYEAIFNTANGEGFNVIVINGLSA